MAAEIQTAFDAVSELFPEGKGIFDVIIDGELIFSKYQSNRFPTSGEVVNQIKHRLKAQIKGA